MMPERRPALARRPPRGGTGQPGTAALRGAGRMARRIGRPRSQGPGALGLRLGGNRQGHGAHSLPGDPGLRGALPRSVRAPSASAGSCGGWRPIARASSWPRCPRSATKCACCSAWAGRRPTCTWAASRPRILVSRPEKRPRGWLLPARARMEKAVMADFAARLLHAIVRRFLGDDHVVHVALAQPCGRDPEKARFLPAIRQYRPRRNSPCRPAVRPPVGTPGRPAGPWRPRGPSMPSGTSLPLASCE